MMRTKVARCNIHLTDVSYSHYDLRVGREVHSGVLVQRNQQEDLRSSSEVRDITIGPYQATGSWSGFPDTRRKQIPSSPACTMSSSPRPEQQERSIFGLGCGRCIQPADRFCGHSERTRCVAELPSASKHIPKPWRVVSAGRLFLRPAGTVRSR